MPLTSPDASGMTLASTNPTNSDELKASVEGHSEENKGLRVFL